MIEIRVLASGSSGNAALVRCNGTAILVDAGLSARQLAARLEESGIAPSSLAGILLTHEHGDHAGGLPVLLARHAVPVYCNARTAGALQEWGLARSHDWRIFSNGQEFSVGGLSIRPFSVPHDAADPVGFRISGNGVHLGVLTDLGYPTRAVFDALAGIHGLFIETNHDENLLQKDTRRPWPVKQRISSRHGHLSNAAAARAVLELLTPSLRTVILGHLSRDCNTPELALQAIADELRRMGRADIGLHCAEQTATPLLRIGGDPL